MLIRVVFLLIFTIVFNTSFVFADNVDVSISQQNQILVSNIQKLDFVSDTQFSKMIGNGVVIPVVEKIFVNVLKAYVEQSEMLLQREHEKKIA